MAGPDEFIQHLPVQVFQLRKVYHQQPGCLARACDDCLSQLRAVGRNPAAPPAPGPCTAGPHTSWRPPTPTARSRCTPLPVSVPAGAGPSRALRVLLWPRRSRPWPASTYVPRTAPPARLPSYRAGAPQLLTRSGTPARPPAQGRAAPRPSRSAPATCRPTGHPGTSDCPSDFQRPGQGSRASSFTTALSARPLVARSPKWPSLPSSPSAEAMVWPAS